METKEKYFERLQKQLSYNPKDVKSLIDMGALQFLFFHDHEKALFYLNLAIECDPKSTEARFWLALCYYYDFCEYEKAKKTLEEALRLDPKRADCLSIMASLIWESDKDLNESIIYMKKSLQSAPDWPFSRHKLATLLLETGDVEKAEKEAEIGLVPMKPTVQFANLLEKYYETVITGRGILDLHAEFSELLQKIEEAKQKKSNL